MSNLREVFRGYEKKRRYKERKECVLQKERSQDTGPRKDIWIDRELACSPSFLEFVLNHIPIEKPGKHSTKIALKLLFANLIRLHHIALRPMKEWKLGGLVVPANSNFWKIPPTESKAFYTSVAPVNRAIKELDGSLITVTPGYYDKDDPDNRRTRTIKPTDLFVELYETFLEMKLASAPSLTPVEPSIRRINDRMHKLGVLRIRDLHGKDVFIPKGSLKTAGRYRSIIKKLNKLNSGSVWTVENPPHIESGAMIPIYDDLGSRLSKSATVLISHHNLSYKRVFNGSLDFGGRYYCFCLHTIRACHRSTIKIDNENTIELDYSSQHFHILYDLVDKPLNEDPYTICNSGFSRAEIKTGSLMLLNGVDREKFYLAYNKKIARLRQRLEYENQYFSLLGKGPKHATIPKYITKQNGEMLFDEILSHHTILKEHSPRDDLGISLQNWDSKIATAVVEHFIAISRPIYLIHDGFRVKESDQTLLYEAMADAYQKTMGTKHHPQISRK